MHKSFAQEASGGTPMHESHIHVPATLSDFDLVRFFIGWRWVTAPVGPVVLDFREANFLSPWAIALFAAYGIFLKEAKRKKVQVLLDPRSVAGSFAVDLGLPALLPCRLSAPSHTPEQRTDRSVPLTRIRTSADIPTLADRVMQVLAIIRLPSVSPGCLGRAAASSRMRHSRSAWK